MSQYKLQVDFACNCDVSHHIGSCRVDPLPNYQSMERDELEALAREWHINYGIALAHLDHAAAQNARQIDFKGIVERSGRFYVRLIHDLKNRIAEHEHDAKTRPLRQADQVPGGILSYAKDVKRLEDEISRLKTENSDYRGKVHELRSQLDFQLNNGPVCDEDQLSTLAQRLERRQTIDSDLLRSVMNEKNELLERFQELYPRLIADRAEQLNALNAQIHDLLEKNNVLRAAAAVGEERKTLQKKFDNAQRILAKQGGELAGAQNEVASLKTVEQNLTSQLQTYQAEKSAAEEHYKTQCSQYKNRIETHFSHAINTMKKNTNEAVQQANHYKAMSQRQVDMIGKAQRDVREQQEVSTKLKQELTTLRTTLIQVQARIVQLEAEKAAICSTMEDHQARCQREKCHYCCPFEIIERMTEADRETMRFQFPQLPEDLREKIFAREEVYHRCDERLRTEVGKYPGVDFPNPRERNNRFSGRKQSQSQSQSQSQTTRAGQIQLLSPLEDADNARHVPTPDSFQSIRQTSMYGAQVSSPGRQRSRFQGFPRTTLGRKAPATTSSPHVDLRTPPQIPANLVKSFSARKDFHQTPQMRQPTPQSYQRTSYGYRVPLQMHDPTGLGAQMHQRARSETGYPLSMSSTTSSHRPVSMQAAASHSNTSDSLNPTTAQHQPMAQQGTQPDKNAFRAQQAQPATSPNRMPPPNCGPRSEQAGTRFPEREQESQHSHRTMKDMMRLPAEVDPHHDMANQSSSHRPSHTLFDFAENWDPAGDFAASDSSPQQGKSGNEAGMGEQIQNNLNHKRFNNSGSSAQGMDWLNAADSEFPEWDDNLYGPVPGQKRQEDFEEDDEPPAQKRRIE